MTKKCEIIHLPDRQRFEVETDGYTAVVDYVIENGFLDITRTYVPHEIGGRGLAAALVEAAYTYAEEHELRCKGTCSYATVWLDRHPEYKN